MNPTINQSQGNSSDGKGHNRLPADSDFLYYPLFPPILGKKETYQLAHDKLMAEMRKQIRAKNIKKIEKTGKKIFRLRKKYRECFAA